MFQIQTTYQKLIIKNFIRDDNRAENLEWTTHEDNIQYSVDAGNYVRYGENNSNYGKHALRDIYKNNPELALEKQNRPGIRNGRSRKIKLIDTIDDKEMIFGYIRAAAHYLVENGFTRAKHVDSVSVRLSEYATNGKIYMRRFYVEFID